VIVRQAFRLDLGSRAFLTLLRCRIWCSLVSFPSFAILVLNI
jgi:hypothetical protein